MNLRTRIVMSVAAGSAIASAACLGVSSPASAGNVPLRNSTYVPTSSAVTIAVPTNQAWTDTGVALRQQEKFTITATGEASPSPGTTVGPAGVAFTNQNCANNQYAGLTATPFTAPGLPCYALIGRIGNAPIVFKVGGTFTLKAPQPGELSLGFNDSYLGDNSGSFTVTITTP